MASGLENIETIESPFRRFVTTIGVFPTAFTDAMTYYECLAYLVKYLEDTVIPAVNENAEALEELQTLYIQLKSYVDNYFANLDVQEEIDNKLDEMATTGQLQYLINHYFSEVTARIDEQDAAIEAQNTTISDAIEDQNSTINALGARMDTFTHLTDGSTSGDAELADIRVGYNGATYASAGTAVRTQITDNYNSQNQLFGEYARLTPKFNLINSDTPTEAGFYVNATGAVVSLADITAYEVPVEGGKTLLTSAGSSLLIFLSEYEDMSNWSGGEQLHNFISSVTTTTDSPVATIPDGAKFMITSFADNAAIKSIYYGTAKSAKKDSITGKGLEVSDFNSLDYFYRNFVKKEIGNNIFNKDTANKAQNCWVRYQDGKLGYLDNYYAVVVPLDTTQTKLSCNSVGSENIAFFSEIVDLNEYNHPLASGTYYQLDSYISGVVGNQNVTIPDGAKCAIFSVATSRLDTFMANYGESAMTYEPYVEGISKNNVIGLTLDGNTYVVDSHGNGDYTTISDAVLGVPNYSVIYVNPGTYNESVDVRSTNKTLYIKGINRDECIITQPVTDYAYPPMEIGKGLVENITFNTTGYDTVPGQYTAYCVHIDYEQERNHALQFKNCKFINTIRECIGIGTRENCHISFTDCEFECESRVVFIHEEQADNKKNQNVEFINCSIKGGGNYPVIKMQETSSYIGNECNIKFQRCIVKNTNNHTPLVEMYDHTTQTAPTGNKWLNSDIWTLDFMSDMNNIEVLNA